MEDRVEAVCDLLMGAAYADAELHEKEKEAVESFLKELLPDGELSPALEARIAAFAPDDFDLDAVLSEFAADSKDDRKKLLGLVAAVHAVDEEFDFDEDAFLLKVASGLSLSKEDTADHAWDYEVENLKEHLAKLRPAPPKA